MSEVTAVRTGFYGTLPKYKLGQEVIHLQRIIAEAESQVRVGRDHTEWMAVLLAARAELSAAEEEMRQRYNQ